MRGDLQDQMSPGSRQMIPEYFHKHNRINRGLLWSELYSVYINDLLTVQGQFRALWHEVLHDSQSPEPKLAKAVRKGQDPVFTDMAAAYQVYITKI